MYVVNLTTDWAWLLSVMVHRLWLQFWSVLRDPALVEKLQEKCGVRVISEVKKEDILKESNNERLSTKSLVNGAIAKLATQPVIRKQSRRKQPGVKIDSLSSSPDTASPPPEFPDIIVETYPLVDFYFKFASELGYEPFYIIFLSLLHWNIDSYVFRHLVILWALSMYVGQALKTIIKWPRPPAPPIVRLEENMKLEFEYGFPSTHATVSTTLPFYLLYMVYWRYETFFIAMIFISIIWCVSVCFSRIYLGLHSFADILGGFTISLIMLAVLLPFLTVIDNVIFNSPYFPLMAVLLVLIMLYIYPIETFWTSDRGDTAAIVGAAFGMCLAMHFHGPFPDDLDKGPFVVHFPSYQSLVLALLRFIIGILLVYPTRFIMKLLCYRFLPAIVPTHGVDEVGKRPLVELPYKIVTYGTLAFSAAYLCPIVFEMCGINRY